MVQSADEYRLDTSRIGLWGASAGGNLAAAVALRHSREQRQPALRFVSLVVPVTAHPRAQAAFIEQRTLARSELEEKVADAKPAPEAVVRDFEKLYGTFTDMFLAVRPRRSFVTDSLLCRTRAQNSTSAHQPTSTTPWPPP